MIKGILPFITASGIVLAGIGAALILLAVSVLPALGYDAPSIVPHMVGFGCGALGIALLCLIMEGLVNLFSTGRTNAR